MQINNNFCTKTTLFFLYRTMDISYYLIDKEIFVIFNLNMFMDITIKTNILIIFKY